MRRSSAVLAEWSIPLPTGGDFRRQFKALVFGRGSGLSNPAIESRLRHHKLLTRRREEKRWKRRDGREEMEEKRVGRKKREKRIGKEDIFFKNSAQRSAYLLNNVIVLHLLW